WIVTDLVMSDSEHSIVSYTSISSDSDPSAWGIPLMDADKVSEMDPYKEVAQQGHVAPPSPAYVPNPIELEHHVPVYVSEPVEDPEEDLEEDPIDYAADADDDEDEDEVEESFEDDDEEEEDHLAHAVSIVVASLAVDPIPSTEETKPFETDESAAIPPHHLHTVLLLDCLSDPRHIYHSLMRQSQDLVKGCITTTITYITTTHHPLPLPTPSTSRRAVIPEVDIPPRKRLLLTAPTLRFEVGESSVVAAKQPGSTVTCRVDYSFVDTVDASIRALERKTMAAIEMVNLKVSYQAQVHRRESKEFYTRHQDAPRDRAALRDEALDRSDAYNRALEARIAVLETQAYRHEWQRQDTDDHATRAIMRMQALEAGARVDTLEDTGSSA
ncbi:hypothetical protein Tco_1326071, partial [Tanacetum coccineum]